MLDQLAILHLSRVVRKPAFCICENKDADQLRGNREADQRLCFRYTDSTIPLLPKSEISSLYAFSVTVQPGLCRTCSETPKTGFLRTRPIGTSPPHYIQEVQRDTDGDTPSMIQSTCMLYSSFTVQNNNSVVMSSNIHGELRKD